MSMSTHVVGFIPPDEKYKKMLAIAKQCNELDISYPKEVDDFFDGVTEPEERGYEVDLGDEHGVVTEWRDDTRQGFELDVSKIPEKVKVVRFYNSW